MACHQADATQQAAWRSWGHRTICSKLHVKPHQCTALPRRRFFGRAAIALLSQSAKRWHRALPSRPGRTRARTPPASPRIRSFGQIHVRGDHANLQYRLNGIILPEGLNVFGQVFQTRLAHSVSLITGALPAQ
jgi:hypothetical protein